MAMDWAAAASMFEAMLRCAAMTIWAGTARDGLVMRKTREKTTKCAVTMIGAEITILVMSSKRDAATSWAAIPSQMQDEMVTGIVEQVGHTYFNSCIVYEEIWSQFRDNLNPSKLQTKPSLKLFQHASWR